MEAMDQAFRLAMKLQLGQLFRFTMRTSCKENDDASFKSWHDKDVACAILALASALSVSAVT